MASTSGDGNRDGGGGNNKRVLSIQSHVVSGCKLIAIDSFVSGSSCIPFLK